MARMPQRTVSGRLTHSSITCASCKSARVWSPELTVLGWLAKNAAEPPPAAPSGVPIIALPPELSACSSPALPQTSLTRCGDLSYRVWSKERIVACIQAAFHRDSHRVLRHKPSCVSCLVVSQSILHELALAMVPEALSTTITSCSSLESAALHVGLLGRVIVTRDAEKCQP